MAGYLEQMNQVVVDLALLAEVNHDPADRRVCDGPPDLLRSYAVTMGQPTSISSFMKRPTKPRKTTKRATSRGTRSSATILPSATCLDIHAALVSLAATRTGFEGLTAALIEAASGGGIRLMASGDQLGLDGIADARAGGPRRAMQAKRYRDTTKLDQTLLIGEMTRAHEAYPTIDCWILTTTQQLHGKEARALQSHAESIGWGLVPLDWSLEQPGLPRLAVLCALHPDVCSQWPEMSAVSGSLNALTSMPGFEAASAKVRADLDAADVGFAAARRAAIVQMNRIWSDRAAARHLAGPSPALLAEAPAVPRTGLRSSIMRWWATSTVVQALLGTEGMGKTWAALDGLRSIAGFTDGPIPIVIPSSLAKNASDGLAAVVAALCAIGGNDGLRVADPPSFWRRRLAIWARAVGSDRPRILVMIDGLDELDPFDWQAWTAALLTADHGGLFRLLVTCRPDEWSHRIGLRETAFGQLSETPVGHFEASERDGYLRSRGVGPSAVSAAVLEAALHPRTAFHLTRLADELGDLTRITREQLLLRDFRNYYSIKLGIMSPDAFAELVRRMAVAAQEAALAQSAYRVSHGEMLSVAADITGYDRSQMRSVLSALVNGSWFTRDPASPTWLIFTDAGLPDAVGLALADLVHRLTPDEAATEITRFLEPWGADDLVEKVLRTCATALVVDERVGDELCSAALDRWRRVPNHGSGGDDFWRRLHVFRPHLFLDLCERHGNRGGWLLEWGIAKLWEDHPSARDPVTARLSSWLSRVGVPGDRSAMGEGANHQRERQRRRAATLDRLGPGNWVHRIGTDQSALPPGAAKIAGRVIGFLPRTPFVPLLRDWAINCAAAGLLTHERVVEVLLRFNDRDPAAALEAVRVVAKSMAVEGTIRSRTAAAYLLRSTGDPEDAELANGLKAPPTRLVLRAFERVVVDGEPIVRPVDDRPIEPRSLFSSLLEFAADPTVSLDEATAEALGSAVASLTSDDVPRVIAGNAPALCIVRWHPERAFALVRDYLLVRDVPDPETDPEAIGVFREIAINALPFLGAHDCALLGERLAASALAEPRDQDPNGSDPERPGAGHRQAVAFRLAHRPHAEQIDVLHAAAHWPDGYHFLLNRPTPMEMAAYVQAIDFDADEFVLSGRLAIATALLRRYEHDPIQRGWSRGFRHHDGCVRRRTMAVARLCDDERAARRLAATGWSAKTTIDVFETFEGSGLLEALDDDALRPVLGRLSPDSLAHLYLHRPSLRGDVAPFWRAWMADELLVVRRSRSFGGDYCQYVDRDASFAIWCVDHHDDVVAMLRACSNHSIARENLIFDHGEGAGWALLRGVADTDGGFVKSVWRGSLDDTGTMFISSTEHFPARLPPGEAFDDLRGDMIGRARTDERLFAAVRALVGEGHEAFLRDWIVEHLTQDQPEARAIAMTVAGFLDADEGALALWEGALAASPGPGWLAMVYEDARAAFESAQASRHWHRAMSEAGDEEAAVRELQLLGHVGDDRVRLFFRKPGFAVDGDSWRARWLDFLYPDFKSQRERFGKSLDRSWLRGPRPSDILQDR